MTELRPSPNLDLHRHALIATGVLAHDYAFDDLPTLSSFEFDPAVF
jgi:hypothetical protein